VKRTQAQIGEDVARAYVLFRDWIGMKNRMDYENKLITRRELKVVYTYLYK
jgi:hypothetical protein